MTTYQSNNSKVMCFGAIDDPVTTFFAGFLSSRELFNYMNY